MLGLREGLRTGDVFVPGSRRYSDLAAAQDELDEALGELEVLARGDGPVRLGEAGYLVISPLSAADIPAEATA